MQKSETFREWSVMADPRNGWFIAWTRTESLGNHEYHTMRRISEYYTEYVHAMIAMNEMSQGLPF